MYIKVQMVNLVISMEYHGYTNAKGQQTMIMMTRMMIAQCP